MTIVSREDKLKWIKKHPHLFRITDESYKHPYINTIAHVLSQMIRSDFPYSLNTADCDLVWTWLSLYRKNKDQIKLKTMSRHLDHEKLEQNITEVLLDPDMEQHWPLVKMLFPSIYQEVKDNDWNRIYRIGHVYARHESSSGDVKSLIMPVLIKNKVGNTVRLLNLIAGNFWEPSVVHNHSDKNLSDDEWEELTRNWSRGLFKHIGEFSHTQTQIYLAARNKTIYLYPD